MRRKFEGTLWLNIIYVLEVSFPSDRFVTEVEILFSVNRKDKSLKINEQTPQTVITEETTAMLSKMFAKTVKRCMKGRDVEDIAQEDKFAIQ